MTLFRRLVDFVKTLRWPGATVIHNVWVNDSRVYGEEARQISESLDKASAHMDAAFKEAFKEVVKPRRK